MFLLTDIFNAYDLSCILASTELYSTPAAWLLITMLRITSTFSSFKGRLLCPA